MRPGTPQGHVTLRIDVSIPDDEFPAVNRRIISDIHAWTDA